MVIIIRNYSAIMTLCAVSYYNYIASLNQQNSHVHTYVLTVIALCHNEYYNNGYNPYSSL